MTQRWTPKRAVARSKRRLAAAAERLRQVACEWGDIDDYYSRRADELKDDVERFAKDIESEVAERLAAGEEIG